MSLTFRASATRTGRGRPASIALALGLLVVLAWASLALAAPKFPPLTGRVVDAAQMLSADSQTRLEGELAALEQKTGHQVVVATVPDLQGYEIEDYGYQLGRAWGIGDKDRDDGVVFLIAPAQKKVRIEVGYGLEPVLTDALTSLILQRTVLPAFKAGDMEGGVVAGTEAIVAQLGLPKDEALAVAAQAAQAAQPQGSSGGVVPVIIFIFIVLFVLSRLGGGWWWLPFLFSGGGGGGRDHWGGGGGGGGFGGGGFSGGGGSFGGGGSSGSW